MSYLETHTLEQNLLHLGLAVIIWEQIGFYCGLIALSLLAIIKKHSFGILTLIINIAMVFVNLIFVIKK
jgi:hypothetical protein